MAVRRILVGVTLPLLLAAAVGLAVRVFDTPANLFSGTSGPLSSTSVALPAVLVAGLADGINPCAFTVLLLFVATVGSMYRGVLKDPGQQARKRLLLLVGTFIAAIFVTYLSLGVGLFRASTLLAGNHVGARLGALVAIFLGLWMLKDALAPGWGPGLRAPAAVGNLIGAWGRRASLGATFGLGVLVGLCTVPCSGAVYIAVLSMLALQTSFLQAYVYLILYNLMFVLPLVAILVAASARPTLNRMAHWNHHHHAWARLALGSGVTALGLAILATV